jgi:superfamily II DNA or RNA helicase
MDENGKELRLTGTLLERDIIPLLNTLKDDIPTNQKSVIFASNIEDARSIVYLINRDTKHKAAAFVSKSPDSIMDEYNNGKYNILTTCNKLSEGSDIADTDNIFLIAPTLSLRKYKQTIGRVTKSRK